MSSNYYHQPPDLLDRSPSLSSDSSGASSASLPPVTPALPPSSSFPSLSYKDEDPAAFVPLSNSSNNLRSSNRGSIASLAAYARNKESSTISARPTSQPWSAGHRTGAGSGSLDSVRSAFGPPRSISVRTNLLAKDPPDKERSPSPASGSNPSNGRASIAAWRSSTTPGRPLPHPQPPSPTARSFTRSPSPTHVASPYQAASPTHRLPPSPSSAQVRAVASSIFSSRDGAVPPPPSSPLALSSGLEKSVVGSVRGLGADGRGGSFARGHRRAMTLPQLGATGLPVPADKDVLPGEEVAGLPGRVRLSRPADAPSHFAPSAVFSSSHGLSRVAGSSMSPLLPSQTVRAIDRQRHDLVAYEYLCHIAEAKEWLTSTIAENAAQTLIGQTSIGEFEQSLRNGYAIAHLARSLGGPECAGRICNEKVLQYKHTGNIDIFFTFVRSVQLPEIFRFETVDLYEAKNLPKVIYCLHALSHLLARRGMAQRMNNLVGQINFTDAEMDATQRDLNNAGVRMPNFGGIGKALARQINEEPEPEPETEKHRQDRLLKAAVPTIVGLQARARAAIARQQFAAMQRKQRAFEAEQRRMAEEERVQAEQERRQRAEDERRRAEAARLQAIADEEARYAEAVRQAGIALTGFQAAARGALARRRLFSRIDRLGDHEESLTRFQAVTRGVLARRRYDGMLNKLGEANLNIASLQAVIRSFLARRRLLERIILLRSTEPTIVKVQAQIRGALARRAFNATSRQLRRTEVVRSVGGFQSLARAALVRRRVDVQRKELGFIEPDVVAIQAHARGYLAQQAFWEWHDRIHGSVDRIVGLQALLRGALARRRFANVRSHFKQNLSKVVQLQAAIRSRRQGSQYRQLRMGTNVPVSTIKNFVRLLDDSEFDYREELQVEALRKQLVKEIRDTQTLEDDVKELDTKIALLVKNKITHEVARAQRAAAGGLGANVRNSLLAAANDPFAPDSLDRQTQRKLELYQQLFGLLQTSPRYLARLLSHTNRSGATEKMQKTVESTIFTVFGYAQNQREEYLLLKLIQCSIHEELESIPDLQTFARTNFPFMRLLVQYGRGVNQRKYLKDLLGPWVRSIMDDADLDFECSPVEIYRGDIAAEETYTGRPSLRPLDVNFHQAIADPNTKKVLIRRLQDLKRKTDEFLDATWASTRRIPFGVRFVAREVFSALKAKFPHEPETEILRLVAHLVYYRFIQPAAVAPETFDIVEGVVIPPPQRKNLADACKLLNQISVGRLYNDDLAFMTPMNPYITAKSKIFLSWIRDVINVEDAETHFRADEYLDAAAARRPVIYISPNDIYATHSLMTANLTAVAPVKNDPLRLILAELGGVPVSNNQELSQARADEVALTLMTRLRDHEDPDARSKALFNEVKRRVLAILKVHHGNDLEAVLAQPVTEEDEETWRRVVEEEEEEECRQAQQQRRAVIAAPGGLRDLSFHELKHTTIQDVMQLRAAGLVDRADKYQAILNAIAADIRSKHHRRIQRQQELGTMQASLALLHDKRRYLDEQKASYNNYISQSMASIQKKGKRRLVLPWTMQGVHQRQLEKTGRSYRFGSFKYTAQTLYDRGILLSIDQYSPKQFNAISLTISSDEIGLFEIQAAYMGVPVTTVELKLEELLEMQFVGKQTVSIGGIAKANLNLLIHQINKKFVSG